MKATAPDNKLGFSLVAETDNLTRVMGVLVHPKAFFKSRDEFTDTALRCEAYFAALSRRLSSITVLDKLKIFIPIDHCINMPPVMLNAALSRMAYALSGHPFELILCIKPAMGTPWIAEQFQAQIKALGFSLAAYGVGLSYDINEFLAHCPVRYVLLAPSFLTDALQNRVAHAFLTGILSTTRQLDIKSIACGIQTEDQRLFVQEASCDYLTGPLAFHPEIQNDVSDPAGIMPAYHKIIPWQSIAQINSVLTHYARTRALTVASPIFYDRSLLVIASTLNELPNLSAFGINDRVRAIMASGIAEAKKIIIRDSINVILIDGLAATRNLSSFLTELSADMPSAQVIFVCSPDHFKAAAWFINKHPGVIVLAAPYSDAELANALTTALNREAETRELIGLRKINRQLQTQLTGSAAHQAQTIVDRKSSRHQMDILAEMSQDMLFKMPFIVMGFDQDGMLTFSNGEAQDAFPRTRMLGGAVSNILPPALATMVEYPDNADVHILGEAQQLSRSYRVQTVLLNVDADGNGRRGTLLIMIPNQ